MFTFNFQKQFADDVEQGIKRQTIRAERKDKRRPKVGEHLRHYTGMRTTSCRKLMDAICRDVVDIQIYHEDFAPIIVVGGRKLTNEEAYQLALLDGFTTRTELIRFFRETHRLPFSGFITKW